MRVITDRVILFALCVYFLIPYAFSFEFFLSLFVSISMTAILLGLRQKQISVVGCLLFFILSLFLKAPLYAFTPLIAYEFSYSLLKLNSYKVKYDRNFLLIIVCLIAALCGTVNRKYDELGFPGSFLLGVLLLLSLFMTINSHTSIARSLLYEHEQNTSRALKVEMQKRQELLLEQQNAEVHVATLSERNRIAREIHDNVGHVLSRALIMTGALEVVNKQPELIESISELKTTLAGAMESVRSSVHDLRDESIDLTATIRGIVSEFTFCPVELDLDSGWYMNKNTKYCVVSIIREALTNTARHSNATRVHIMLREHENQYQLLVEDNGTVSINSDGTGMGLDSMRDRVRAVGGTIYITRDAGFRIFVTFPRLREN